MADFEVGQIFEDSYPPEAAMCNESGKYFIEEIEKEGDKRRFQIKETPAPTNNELAERALGQRDALIAKTEWHTVTLQRFRQECIQVCAYVVKRTKNTLTLAFSQTDLNNPAFMQLRCKPSKAFHN